MANIHYSKGQIESDNDYVLMEVKQLRHHKLDIEQTNYYLDYSIYQDTDYGYLEQIGNNELEFIYVYTGNCKTLVTIN